MKRTKRFTLQVCLAGFMTASAFSVIISCSSDSSQKEADSASKVPQPVTVNGQIAIRESYLPVLRELAEIECAYLERSGIVVPDTSVYQIHSIAFQEVLKDLDRTVLAHYEDLFQLLARYEFLMTPEERSRYEEDIQQVYSEWCGN